MVGNLVEVSFDLVLAPADAAGLVPVKLRSVERAVGQADAGHAFPLAPASRPVAAPQALKLANGRADRERLNLGDGSDDREVHEGILAGLQARGGRCLTIKVELRGHDEQNGDRAEPRAIGQLLGPRPLQPALGRHGGTGSAIRVAWHRADRGALILRSARRAPVFGRSRCLAERGVKRAVGEHGASAEGPRHRVRRPMAACDQEAADEKRSNCLRHERLREIACARSFGARPNEQGSAAEPYHKVVSREAARHRH